MDPLLIVILLLVVLWGGGVYAVGNLAHLVVVLVRLLRGQSL